MTHQVLQIFQKNAQEAPMHLANLKYNYAKVSISGSDIRMMAIYGQPHLSVPILIEWRGEETLTSDRHVHDTIRHQKESRKCLKFKSGRLRT
ncbi:unnamed protein product, partial [Mesorhabditis spiculigera]